MKYEIANRINNFETRREACVLITNLSKHTQQVLSLGDFKTTPLAAMLTSFRSQKIESEGEPYFLRFFTPPLNMLITGAVHISQCLLPLARSLGYEPIIIDPRTAFATPERFPNVKLIQNYPKTYPLDAYTAFIALTHDPKIDDPALEAALTANCFYIGALGSKKTHKARLERLSAKGFSNESLATIKAPIGLDIGAISPEEIALAIMAEVLLARKESQL